MRPSPEGETCPICCGASCWGIGRVGWWWFRWAGRIRFAHHAEILKRRPSTSLLHHSPKTTRIGLTGSRAS